MFAFFCWAVENGVTLAPSRCNCWRCGGVVGGAPLTVPGSAVALFWVALVIYCGYGSFRRLFAKAVTAVRGRATQAESN